MESIIYFVTCLDVVFLQSASCVILSKCMDLFGFDPLAHTEVFVLY